MTDTADPAPPPVLPAAPPRPAPEPPIAMPEETHVEIHKVKPIHTWRDFLKELGTIVLGIIIAISLEHLVQSWSWDQEVKEARKALAAEISANNVNILAFRVAVGPCVNREISKVDAMLTALEAGTKPENIKLLDLRRTPSSLIRDSEWQSERASQVLTHFPRGELALMSRYYAQLDDFKNWMAQEAIAWSELSVLQKPLAGMTTSDLIRLRANLVIVKDDEYRIVLNAGRQLAVTKQLDIPVPAVDLQRVKNYCTMSTEEYRRYRNSQDLR